MLYLHEPLQKQRQCLVLFTELARLLILNTQVPVACKRQLFVSHIGNRQQTLKGFQKVRVIIFFFLQNSSHSNKSSKNKPASWRNESIEEKFVNIISWKVLCGFRPARRRQRDSFHQGSCSIRRNLVAPAVLVRLRSKKNICFVRCIFWTRYLVNDSLDKVAYLAILACLVCLVHRWKNNKRDHSYSSDTNERSERIFQNIIWCAVQILFLTVLLDDLECPPQEVQQGLK